MGKSKNDDLGFDDWFNDGDLGGDDGGAAQRAREEEEAKAKAAEAEAKRKADAARAEAEAKRKAAEEEAKRKAAEEEAKRKAAEEEAKRKAAEEEAKRKAAEEARLKAEAEAARARAEEEARLKAAEEARRRAAEEEAKRKAAEEEAKRKAAEEAARARALEDDWFGSGEADSTPAAQPTQAEPVAAPPVAAPPVAAAPIVPQPAAQAPAAAVEEEEEEFEATADSFVDTQPDQTMVLRREGRDGASDEVATALAAREAWRAQNATTNLAEAQPEPEAAPAETGEAMVESLPDSAAEPVDAPQPSGPTLAPPPTVVEEVEAALPVAVGQSSPAAEATARWSEAAAILEAEGNAASDNTLRATLLAEAGRIHWSKLSQAEEAEKLLGQAVAAGVLLPPVLKAFGDTVAHRGDFGLLRQVLELRAQHSGHAVAAEALQDAALVERNVLKQDAAAVALLDKAITLVPDDWFTLRLLRETHYRTRNWDGLCATLARMAALVSGPRAARYLVERGRIFEEQLGQSAEARAAYDAAFEADPGFAPAFLAVERQALSGGDVERLARLYAAEAARLQGADAGFWWARAARCGMRAGLDAAWVDDAVSRAIRTSPIDPIELRHEHQVWLAAHERHEDLLGALRDELDRTAPDARAPLLALIGALEEKVHGVDQATEVLTAALYDFSAMDPLLDTLERLLGQAGRHAELAAVFETHGSHVSDPASVVSLSYRLGELCEGALGDLDRARAAYARVLEVAPGYLPALDGLERVFSRQSAWEPLLEQYLHRAALAADDSAGQALHLHRAAVLAEFRIGDAGRARDLYKQAMERNASFKPSLEAYVRLLEQEGDFAALADALVRASQGAEDGNEVVGHTYRAARLYADRLARPDQAISCLRRCLELSPGFLPAIALLRQLCEASGAWRDAYELHRQEAESLENPTRRHWRMLAAAEAATHLPDVDPASVAQEILSEDPTHGGALSLLERRAIQTDDSAALVEVYHRAAAGASPQTAARLAVRVADLSRDSGDATGAITAATEALSLEVEGRPLRAIARLCESVHYWEEACRALSATGSDADTVEIARIQETYVGDAATSAAAWRKVLEIDPTNTEAAAGMERSLTRLGQRDGLGDAHAILAENLPDDAIRNVHALLAGHLFEAEGDAERAIRYYRMAFEARPAWGKAFDGLRRLFVSAGDADALEALFAALPDASQAELAAALEDAGHAARAAELYRSEIGTRLADDPELLPLTLHLELCLTEVEDWRGVFETVTLRMPYLRSPEQRQAAEARRRWVLAEKLAETEEAWEHYRALYKDSPNDPEILVPLARIAAARGEIDLAVEYLQGLTRNTADRAEAARYQRQIAEILTNKGDLEGARQAWLLALDLLPEDLDALAGLKALAVREENWQGLVGVLAREATMLDRADRVARYREIASIWEDRLQNSAVAIDAWRKVNEVAGPDGEALQHLVALTRDQADWPSFVEVARQQLDLLSGAERSALLHEMGQVYLDQLHNESEAIQYLEAASAATPPELGAAALLERIYAGRGEWERAIQAIRRQASGAEPTEAVALLQRAAGIALDTLHDQDAAAGLYAEVLALDPVNADALRFRGTWLYKAGDLAGAVEVWGHLEGLDGERDLDDFDTRMELSLYYYRFAEAERQLDRTEAALTHYGRALELNPGHLPSLEAVGPLYISAQSWDKAGEVYRQILQLTGGQGDVEKIAQTYVNLGTVESRLGDLDKAKKRFLKALDLRPNHLGALVGMAEVLFAREDWNNLLNTYNLIIYHSQEPSRVVDAYLAKGFVLDAKMNLMEKAVQHYEKSLAFDAGQPVALLRLAEISLRRRDWAAAAGHVDRALGGAVARADVRGGLHLVRAIAAVATGNTEVSNGAFTAALEADPSLADRLGLSPGTVDQMHAVLRERLRASL